MDLLQIGFFASGYRYILMKRWVRFVRTPEISYSWERLYSEMQKDSICDYIQRVGDAIISANTNSLSDLQVKLTVTEGKNSAISYSYDDADSFPTFRYLTRGLISKLKTKQKQLSSHSKNIVFVGVAHLGPINWMTPHDLFLDGRYDVELQKFICEKLPGNVTGVCYYYYQLNKVEPFYPLKIFWRDVAQQIPINLS